jgi:predicted transcriptional regulator|tara:strand:+ start:352 stop:480 length:129 start_codon:yes stop_codon:yes gene_type:complete
MTRESPIAELLDRLDKEIQNPKDSVHKIVLKITIDNINKLIK